MRTTVHMCINIRGILKKMNTKESKEGVKRFFDNTKQNS